MTREEAIEQLKTAYPKKCEIVNGRLKGGFDDHEKPLGVALDMAIKALEQEPCEDLCKSCNTKGCIFQSGIKREKCDFYTS